MTETTDSPSPSTASSSLKKPSNRLVSLDALRGFDMFWIIGGSGLFLALIKFLGLPEEWVQTIQEQFQHVTWDGFHFFDLIFPLFVFMSGITVPYSVLSQKLKGIPVLKIQLKILKRALILILIGLSFSVFKFEDGSVRFYTVLWLIGMSYLIGASISLHVDSWIKKVVIFFSLLLTYHLALFYLPYPGKLSEMTADNNLAAWVDRNFISTNLYRTTYDPEGSIRVIPAGMLCLLGSLVGQRIKSFKLAQARCASELFAGGLCCLLIGFLWSLSFPIVKDLWSPSFILWAAGWSLLLLSLFYLVLDVWKLKWMGWVFLPIGMNAITIYAGQRYIHFAATRDFFFGGFARSLEAETTQVLVLAFGLVFIKWLLLVFLFRKKIFIRV